MDPDFNPEICLNLSYFKDYLKVLRRVDDNIIPKLNDARTKSAESCTTFLQSLSETYSKREQAINFCAKLVNERLESLRKETQSEPTNSSLRAHLYAEETKLRYIKNEYEVENIVRSRSFRVFCDRCRSFVPSKGLDDFLITQPIFSQNST
ncbi:hypothetical protein DSO57_1019539 [Entomophthora muscae]|uniref:Uncharacterized protein n=1 Tax=Entomophthora muscae TaxID=34485 RepID=A0ACC2RIK2_9FUNG|nr:hypothetical protein DSO57_1019539 [Entomophthora muscae]